MKTRHIICASLLLLVTISLSACAAPASPPAQASPPAASASAAVPDKVFTLDELAKYNGKDGMPAYVAVDGIVYDVSGVALWRGGSHQGLHEAGRDMTEEIKQSPHGKKNLEGLPVMGTLAK